MVQQQPVTYTNIANVCKDHPEYHCHRGNMQKQRQAPNWALQLLTGSVLL